VVGTHRSPVLVTNKESVPRAGDGGDRADREICRTGVRLTLVAEVAFLAGSSPCRRMLGAPVTVVPRIYRASPQGPITTASSPIAVIVTLRWMISEPTEVLAAAVAWTSAEVQVEWHFQGDLRCDWVDAVDVRRLGAPRPTEDSERSTARPPRIDTRLRPR